MRKILILATVLALAGCGGGGGGSSQPQPPPVPTAAPNGPFYTPQFTIVVPSGGKSGSSAKVKSSARTPNYVSSGTLSVQITLTADSVGIAPNTITGNPATTVIPANSCNSGCTVNGPPSPPGTDSFLIVTYDNNVPASGHPLNAAQLNNVTITAGQNNPQSVTLGAIPKTLSVSGVPTGGGAFTAGTASQAANVSVVAVDAAGVTIPTGHTPNVFYVDATGTAINVTLSDPDTGQHGSCVINTGTSTCTTGAATSVTFSGPDVTRVLAYDGLAENDVTLTASASTATNGTAIFEPKLNAPVFNGSQATPSGVALSGSPEIDLFATSGIGSTGSESFTESGWTNAPYGHALTHAETGACTGTATSMSQIATISTGANDTTNGTPFTATVVGSPVTGSCPSTISDGLSGNGTDGSATLTVTYTTSSISASAKHRHQK
ncbi:MAG: hypothetical protein JO036_21670 [Candidatus Eremiobacteraeota bacterium]|nr:hypothetical protein [Candidatus Eremiobacteraeota bacterium]